MMNRPPVLQPDELPTAKYGLGEIVVYDDDGTQRVMAVDFISPMLVYIVVGGGYRFTAREDELSEARGMGLDKSGELV